MVRKIGVAVFLVMICTASAAAEERLGVVVYPGAKYDQARTKILTDLRSVRGAAYRTSDDIERVVAFYRKQGLLLLKIGDPSKDLARFKKADTGVDVLVQRTRKDSYSGSPASGTLILIFKKKESGNTPDVSI